MKENDENVAARYAALRQKLKKAGRLIPENDIWIAASCLELDAVLLSRDAYFNFVPDLQVINWTRLSGDFQAAAWSPRRAAGSGKSDC